MNRNGLMGILASVVLLWLSEVAWAEVSLTNLVVSQRPGTKLVDISYDVSSTASNIVKVLLAVSNAGVPVNAGSLTGDFGGVVPGAGKSIVWNMGADWNGNLAVLSFIVTGIEVPNGGDPIADSWEVVNTRWVRNRYANGTITVSDIQRGLMWVYDATANGQKNWNSAKSHCDNLVYAGHNDWILPSLNEMYFACIEPVFTNVAARFYWTSTPGPTGQMNWIITEGTRNMGTAPISFSYWVWPCRYR